MCDVGLLTRRSVTGTSWRQAPSWNCRLVLVLSGLTGCNVAPIMMDSRFLHAAPTNFFAIAPVDPFPGGQADPSGEVLVDGVLVKAARLSSMSNTQIRLTV